MEPETAILAQGSLFEERYEIEGELGRGRFGRVYRARQLSTGQPVAIKLLAPREGSDPSSAGREAARFRRETRICAALSHPHLVQLIDSGEAEQRNLYAVFAYVPGETLEQVLAREERLSVRESLRLMTQVLEALACAHAKGIVHRDLKPSNLMLSGSAPRRNAVVLDFGVGGVAEDRRRTDWETLTQAREFVGTPRYASPEQLAGEPATERSDLYSWGLIFLECLTGAPPFSEGGAAGRLLTGGGAVELPGWLRGHRLGALLAKVTAREPARRDLSVEALLEALDEISHGELPVAPEVPGTPPPLADSGECRHLTVMFCDLVGSTALSRQLDAETYGRILRAYQERSETAIARYEGHVVQHLGDGLLAYFGHPQAHDDDPERAVRAGRDILRDLRTLNSRLAAEQGIRLSVRVGIHTGPVVVGETGGQERREMLAVGDTPNIAARLAEIAEPDTVVISEAMRHLLAGRVITEDLGTRPLKGVAKPFRVHRLVESLPRPFMPTPVTPFVGRKQELGLLLDRFAQVQERRGQAVWIAGEPGIGKTRLVQRLREQLEATPHGWLECRGSPYALHSALSPLIELVEQALHLDDVDDPAEKVGRLEGALEIADFDLAEAVPLLASLLSLRLPEHYAPLEISPQLRRQKTLEALLSWVLAVGEKQPVVLVVEDLQWVDPSTLEWLGLLIEQCPTAGVLLILTFRPEFEPPWASHAHLQPIALARLKGSEARELAVGAVPAGVLSEPLVDRIAARSDGVPLFVEELAKSVAETGQDREDSETALAIPETLQDSLMARLDRLGEAKGVAQVGATLGREFPYGLLQAVAPVREEALRQGLGRLLAAELLYQRGLQPKATYVFKHALVQDTAYQSLLESQRRELHGRIADALQARFAERVERDPEEIARHCEAAGRTEQAIGYYRRAGKRATQHFAHAEAVGHLRKALKLLSKLPEGAERHRQELELQVSLRAPLAAGKSYADPEVEAVHARARDLCHEIGEAPELFQAVMGLANFYTVRGDLRTALELAEQALGLAERAGDVSGLLVAHDWLGIILQGQGEFTRSLEQLEEAIRIYDPAEHRPLAYVWGHDPGIHARCFAASTLCCLGHPDRARRMGRETVELAREGDPYSLCLAFMYGAELHKSARARDSTREAAEEALAIAREGGFLYPMAYASIMRGWAIGGTRGLEEVEQARDRLSSVGWEIGMPGIHASIAEVNRDLGRIEDARTALEAAFAFSEKNENRRWDSQLHQLEGELQLASGAVEQAESCFRRALEVARRQEAKGYEIGAATCLAGLLRDRGRRDEARALLEPVYRWFTEGFDTADLKSARALLEDPR